jgi:hypothetical protein
MDNYTYEAPIVETVGSLSELTLAHHHPEDFIDGTYPAHISTSKPIYS